MATFPPQRSGADDAAVPTLSQSYPNPFSTDTALRFTLPAAQHVSLSVYDALGQRVATLMDETRGAGTHEVRLTGAGLPGGTYFVRMTTAHETVTRAAVLSR